MEAILSPIKAFEEFMGWASKQIRLKACIAGDRTAMLVGPVSKTERDIHLCRTLPVDPVLWPRQNMVHRRKSIAVIVQVHGETDPELPEIASTDGDTPLFLCVRQR